MSIENLKFFLSAEQTCSYLPDKRSASVFADPESNMNTALYSILINHGFRRSANYVYRPHCPNCQACKPTRIPAHFFIPSRSQRRILKKNQDIRIIEAKAEFKQSHFDLYVKYIQARHKNGEMDHNDPSRYFEFLDSDWCDTVFYEFFLNETLVAVAVTDVLNNGLSALYSFFDPNLPQRSLGTYAILVQLEKAQSLKKPWLYLGYWIDECEKMRYKKNFKPLEIWENDEWHPIGNINNE